MGPTGRTRPLALSRMGSARAVSVRRPRRPKWIFDPVHGGIEFRGAALELIGHPVLQRLWGIRQTGLAHLVFPGANHTRLEHSLGAYWVARQFAQATELSGERAREVEVGALLHDVGHGPFSHTLEPTMREVFGHGHEEVSRGLITGRLAPDGESGGRSVPDVLQVEGISPTRVADLVDPPPGRAGGLGESLLHGPVDADRIDYLQRDAHYTGVAHGAIDGERILRTARDFRGRLAFEEKGLSALEGLLVGRSLMYASVYYHKTVRAAEVMVQAAVERRAGYPDSARAVLRATDAELLVGLADEPGASGALIRGVRGRRLYKRVFAPRAVSAGARAELGRLARRPAERRAIEDTAATELGGRPGDLLLDLSGLEPRGTPTDRWDRVTLVVDGRPTFPFRRNSLWEPLVVRPPSPWPVAAYVTDRLRRRASGRVARALKDLR